MSIQSQITRISGNVSDALSTIEGRGVTIPSGSNSDDLSTLIAQIEGPETVNLINGKNYIFTDDGEGNITITEDSGSGVVLTTKNVTANGTYSAEDDSADGYSSVTVNVPGITPTGTVSITENGTTDVTNYASASVNVQPDLQAKSVTPSESSQVVTPDSGYDGLSQVTVGAIPSEYVVPSGSTEITENGTHDVSGYASAVVDVPSGWTKVAETSYSISTTGTSAATHATWSTGHSELWTANKWIYVRIRDTAGKQDGYFYGSDQFFYNATLANGSSGTSITTAMRIYTRCSGSTLTPTATSGTSGYGVYSDTLYSDGRIRIRKRYNSSNSLTINGTFKVEVYLLDVPDASQIFA